MESEGSSKDYFRKSMAELIAILPQEAGNTKNWEKLLESLANATDFNVVDIRHNDIIDCPTLYIEYKKEVYPIDVDWYEYHFEEDTMAQQFSTENIATLQQATNGIKFSMLYTTDAQTSVHLLLKIICLLVPKQNRNIQLQELLPFVSCMGKVCRCYYDPSISKLPVHYSCCLRR